MNREKTDPERTEAFAERLLDTLNNGALCLMISIGHRTGLFDAMGDLGPSTSAQIAEAADLNERYVREWLGAMLTGDLAQFALGLQSPCGALQAEVHTFTAGELTGWSDISCHS